MKKFERSQVQAAMVVSLKGLRPYDEVWQTPFIKGPTVTAYNTARLDTAAAFGFERTENGWTQYLDTLEEEGRAIMKRFQA